MLVIPTECTDHTEAYGLKVLESTERIDAARHTTEGRIDCLCSVAEVMHGSPPMAAQAIISVDSCLAKLRLFCGFEKFYARRLLCSLCILWELQAKEIQVQEPIPDKLQFTILSLQIPDEPYLIIVVVWLFV